MFGSRVQQFIWLDNEEKVAIWLEGKYVGPSLKKPFIFIFFIVVIVRVVGFFLFLLVAGMFSWAPLINQSFNDW